MNDDEFMKDLFSAFDDVSAPESLKSSTLDFIMSAAAVAPDSAEGEAPVEQAPAVTATRGSKKRVHGKWHAMRAAAVAACLALALTGGAAYAYPASTVLVTQGDTTIELHVNVFGQVLSASASDGATQDLIDQMGLVHTSFEDSVSRVSDSLKETNPQVPVEVVLNGVPQAVEDEGEVVAESHDEAPAAEPVESNAPAEEEPVVLKEEPSSSLAEITPVAYEATPAVETVVSLPEPAGVIDSDDDTDSKPEKPASDEDSLDYEAPSEDSDSDGDEDVVPPVVAPDEGDEPVVPVVIDEDPGVAQEEVADDSSSASDSSDAQPDEKPAYDNTRPPQYCGDEEV